MEPPEEPEEEERQPRKKVRIEMPRETRHSSRKAADKEDDDEEAQPTQNGKIKKQPEKSRKKQLKEEENEEEEDELQPKQRSSKRAEKKEPQSPQKQKQPSRKQQQQQQDASRKEPLRSRREAATTAAAAANGVSERRHRRSSPPRGPSHKQQPSKQQQKQIQSSTRETSQKKRRREPSPTPAHNNIARPPKPSPVPSPKKSTSPAQPAPVVTGGLKRVRSSWRLRPLIVDEKLRVFVEGRDDNELLMYDGGDYWAWLKDCEAGAADPAEGFPYPLVVQDEELRTVLEIKEPAGPPVPTAAAAAAAAKAAAVKRAAAKGATTGTTVTATGITVPTWRVLPESDCPDTMLRAMDPQDVPVVHRNPNGDDSPAPDVVGRSPAAVAAAAAWSSAQAALASDPPYSRYVQATPDDLDLAIEYDLDEEDEEWLAKYNKNVKKGGTKARSSKRPLGEEWLEHLIDRMEKEYTSELQKCPEKWVLGGGNSGVMGGDGGAADPEVTLPPIEEIFPLEKCLQVQGINHYESVIRAVYLYWKEKHRRAGRPLIPRLWYEPPWDRKAAARRLAAAGEDDGVFAGHDSPLALAGIRKRRMDAVEVRSRFESIRRDLESARTLADQVRKREKLKRREAQLLKEEWAARMQGKKSC